MYDPEATADYLAHLRSLGFRIFMMPGALRGMAYGNPAMEPLWAAIEESELIAELRRQLAPSDAARVLGGNAAVLLGLS